MVASAKSANDHTAIADIYAKEAEAAREEAAMLRRLAASYRHDSIMGTSPAGDYALIMANYYDNVAKMAQQLADEHSKMSKTM